MPALPDSNSTIIGQIMVDPNGNLIVVGPASVLTKQALTAAVVVNTQAGNVSGAPNTAVNPAYGLSITAYPFALDPTQGEPYGTREGMR